MAVIKNERDLLLQMDSPRFIIIPINIGDITGLTTALDTVTNTANTALTTAKGIRINASASSFSKVTGSSSTTPSSITLTAELNGLTGSVIWSVVAGSANLNSSGNTCTITGSTVSGYSVTVKATLSGYTAQYTLTKLGALSALDTVNLTNQVTGQLATGNITGLGALALLNTVNLNTQTVGALNGATQVTNLGTLAYANAIAADQIGAGQLAAGVIYAGTVNADKIIGNTITGTKGIQVLNGVGSVVSGMYLSGNYGFLTNQGYLNLETNGGAEILYWNSGNIRLATGLALEIGASSLSGSMGSRIVLKGVSYPATVNGASGYTIQF